MNADTYMPSPMCLIENTQHGKLVINEEALRLLSNIKETVVVVSVVGFYRTGKSYLLNRLAGKTQGFSLGSTVQSHTKGIWMWCRPHPKKNDHCLVLLDTEGLGDIEKGDQKNDSWIFSLAVLLSSTFVYNSVGTIDHYAMDKLHFISNLTELIKVKSNEGDDDDDDDEELELLKISPAFVWAVRDFTLELKINGQDVTADDYLNHGLQLKKGVSKKVMEYNQPRECIRNYFRSRKCFVFVQPTASSNLNQVEKLAESQLDPQFVDVCRAFCQYIYLESQPKQIKGGHRINGRKLAILAQSYVETIASGMVPCIEDTVTSMAKIENTAAVEGGLAHYQQQMELRVKMPTETEELAKMNTLCWKEAIEFFMKNSFNDQDQAYYNQLLVKVQRHYLELCDKNEAVSMEMCTKLLETLSTEIGKKLREGFYTKPGGYEVYKQDRQEVIRQFHSTPGKGNKAEEALSRFMQQKTPEADSVLQADKLLTDTDKKLAAERQRAAEAEQEAKAQEEAMKSLEKLREDEKIIHEENVKYLKLKMEEEREDLQREQKLALDSKLKEQEELLEKGFANKAQMMEEQIELLKKQQDSASNWEKIAKVTQDLLETAIGAYTTNRTMKLLARK
ncbi:guanylate-binding protein 1-like [Scyliorhinus canicula]|uniref:guanylate-binding protein 1-like n=1 Tax=Scyliorhinus canicula TaxID=7830 RepID=UPI0018F28FF0|nr:guanylate-binding protein 1-like [Scyliorhinus canicula]